MQEKPYLPWSDRPPADLVDAGPGDDAPESGPTRRRSSESQPLATVLSGPYAGTFLSERARMLTGPLAGRSDGCDAGDHDGVSLRYGLVLRLRMDDHGGATKDQIVFIN